MPRVVRLPSIMFAWLVLAPAAVYAQASLTGVVRDTSGAVLPGVTVEATSPALIERVRSVVTDGTGQYRIENLRPGAYTVTFTLPGFAIVRREGIQLTGTFTASVNAELRVGSLEETITVTGETPTVDVQNTLTQSVIRLEVMDAIPSGKTPSRMAALIPAVTSEQQDVGGLQGDGSQRGDLVVHGVGDARMVIGGISNHTTSGSRGAQGAYNMAAYAEMTVDSGGLGADSKEGGVRLNLIPKDGGNTFEGYFFNSFANSSMQGTNLTQDLKDRGLGTPDSLKEFLDVNPAFGGPIKRDTVWFHAAMRYNRAFSYVPIFFNKNAGNPNAWTYEPDTSREPASNNYTILNFNGRFTWQATPKNKLAFTYDTSSNCDCPRALSATRAPEANVGSYIEISPKRQISGDWTAPVTSRLLFEAGFYRHSSFTARPRENPYFPPGTTVRMISVTEQSTGLTYRATAPTNETANNTFFGRFVASYITGAHAFKTGFNWGSGDQDRLSFAPDAPISYRFNNGVPNRLTLHAADWSGVFNMDADHGLFIQDRWTVNRLTLTAGLRYDYFHISFPETAVGPTEFAPNRNIVFPALDGVRWHEISPRSGLAFDVFGDGKTALKVGLNRYLAGQLDTQGPFTTTMVPAARLVTSTNRSWRDANGNFVPDCDLASPAASGECGPMENTAFGSTRSGMSYDPDVLQGWGKSKYNWQFAAGVQHELVPRVSVNVGYFRNWLGNFLATDNRAVGPSDYDTFSITAPLDPRLPGGGGYVISGLYDLKPAAFGRPADNFLTLAGKYGKQIEHWNGVDVNVTARPTPDVLFQGGTSTGRRTTDNCEVLAELPELDPVGQPDCHQQEKFLTQIKLLGSYTVSRIGVQVSATLQSVQGPLISPLDVSGIRANYTATNAVVAPSLGRNLAGGASNVTVNLVQPGTIYGDRMNQLDLRIGKILRFGRTRATASFDIYNALNTNPVLSVSEAFATWQRPQSILNARFLKIGVQLDF